MMIYRELKKIIIYHLITGIIFSIILLSVLMLNKYGNSLADTVSRFELIKTNTLKMKHSTADIESRIKHIESLLPADFYTRSPRELIFLTLDDIKTALKRSEVTVTNFDERMDMVSLPVSIKIPTDSYAMLINNIGYLQSLKFPYYTITSIAITKSQDTPEVVCTIDGFLRMPAITPVRQ